MYSRLMIDLLPPHTIPLGRPSAPAPSIQHHASNLDWQLVSYMIFYMFHCLLINVFLLSQSQLLLFASMTFSLPKQYRNFILECTKKCIGELDFQYNTLALQSV